MAKFKGRTTVTESLEVSGNIVDLNGETGTSGQVLSAVQTGDNEVKITASDGAASDIFGNSVAIGNNKIVVGAYGDDDNGGFSGSAYIYDLDGTNQTKITASDGATTDYFGYSVAIGNNKIVVGAYGDASLRGAAYIYDLDGTNETKITASDGAAGDEFGGTVAIANNKIVVGAIGDASSRGAAYIYDLDGTNETKITASDGASNDNFGVGVAIGNNKIVVGAYGDDDNGSLSGSAYIYDLDGTGETKITASDGAASDQFGFSVAIKNNKIVVGANGDASNRGAAYVYNLDGTGETKITASDGASNDRFGWSVAIGNNKIVVGAYADASSRGAAYVYNLDGTGETKITASDGAASDFFGYSVEAGESKIVVGANSDDDNGSGSGSAYVYDLAGTNWKTLGGTSNSSTGITNYIKCVCASATTLATSGTVSTLSWMNTTPSFSNGFSAPTATTITVPNDGLYLIGLNLCVNQTNTANGNRYNHGFEIYINGTATGAEIRNTYIRGAANNSNHFDSSANATKTLKLSANDAITIRNRRLAGNTNSTLQLTTNSSIFVVQIA